jgi:hypothetical protein
MSSHYEAPIREPLVLRLILRNLSKEKQIKIGT